LEIPPNPQLDSHTISEVEIPPNPQSDSHTISEVEIPPNPQTKSLANHTADVVYLQAFDKETDNIELEHNKLLGNSAMLTPFIQPSTITKIEGKQISPESGESTKKRDRETTPEMTKPTKKQKHQRKQHQWEHGTETMLYRN